MLRNDAKVPQVPKVPKVSKEQLNSIIYHDIFDYPLTEEEFLRWEVRGVNVDGEVGSEIKNTGKYFHLKGRSAIVKLRQEREKESAKKLKLARKLSTKLFTINTIRFIGVTGSLAMNNARRESDVDLMIITSHGTLWSTRIVVKIASLLNGFTVRSVGGGESKNAVCFNLWMDGNHMIVPRKMRNLYTAHEVLQVMPLLDRDNTFEKFLEANKWALDFWPNAHLGTRHWALGTRRLNSIAYLLLPIAWLLEPVAYLFQRIYMNRHITRELVEPGRAFFHPIDWSKIVVREFTKKTRSY